MRSLWSRKGPGADSGGRGDGDEIGESRPGRILIEGAIPDPRTKAKRVIQWLHSGNSKNRGVIDGYLTGADGDMVKYHLMEMITANEVRIPDFALGNLYDSDWPEAHARVVGGRQEQIDFVEI